MICRICLRGSCTESFHSLEEQEIYEDALDAYSDADDIKEVNRKRIAELEQEISDLDDEIESAYDAARELRSEIELKQREDT